MSTETTRRKSRRVDIPLAEGCCTPLRVRNKPAPAAQIAILAALADPTRLQIVELLAGLDEPLCVCDIVAQFALGQPTISHHLRVLRDAGLVTWEKRGLWVYYALDRDALEKVTGYLGRLSAAPADEAARTA